MSDRPAVLTDPRFQMEDGRTRPAFLFVGGAKCGSTSFAIYLGAHPQVVFNGPKEPNFWSWGKYPKKYQDFFINQFPIANPEVNDRISGEFSSSYLLHPLTPRRVHAALPDTKIIVMLRNPVDRAYSHFVMSKRGGLEPDCSFDKIIRHEIEEAPLLVEAHRRCYSDPPGRIESCTTTPDGSPIHVTSHRAGGSRKALTSEQDLRNYYFQSYVFRSIYHDQVKRWLALFPADQVLILKSEMFFEDPAGQMSKSAAFLGLGEFDFTSSPRTQKSWGGGASNAWKQPGNYPEMKPETRSLLEAFFRPWNAKLSELTGLDFDWI